MNKSISIIIIIISFSLFLLSCNDEREVNIGQGYYYIPFQETTFDVTMFGGNGIFRYKDSLILPIIFPTIINYRFTSDYVTIKQKFDFTETSILIKSLIFRSNYFNYNKEFVPLEEKYVKDAPQFNNSGSETKFVDSIMHIDLNIKKMTKYKENYYIIDKMKQEVMGPFTKGEFDKKSKTLNLPDKLILE